MTYNLTLPDGSIVPDVPDNLTQEQALARARTQYPDAFGQQQQAGPPGVNTNPLTAPATGLRQGAEGAYSALRTTGRAITGGSDEELRESAARGRQATEGQQSIPGYGSMTEAYRAAPTWYEGAWDAARQVPAAITGGIAQSLPEMAIPAGIGYGAARAAPYLMAFGRGASALPHWIPKAVGWGAMGLAAIPGFFGHNIETQAEETERRAQATGQPPEPIDQRAALAAAVVQGAVDPALAAAVGIFGRSEARAAIGSYIRAGGRGAVTGAAAELPPEIIQEIAQRAQAGQDLLSDEALDAYAEAGTGAILQGGALGGASRARGEAGARARDAAAARTAEEVRQTSRAEGEVQQTRDREIQAEADRVRGQTMIQEGVERRAAEEAAFRARALPDLREQGGEQRLLTAADRETPSPWMDPNREGETEIQTRQRMANVANTEVEGPVQVVPDRNGYRLRNDLGQMVGKVYDNAETAAAAAAPINERMIAQRTAAETEAAKVAEPAAIARAAQQTTAAPLIPLKDLPPPIQQAVRMQRYREGSPQVDAPISITELRAREINPKVVNEIEARLKPDVVSPATGIPAFITRQQRSRLRDLGYTDAQIFEMKPEEAHGRLGAKIGPEPATAPAPEADTSFTPEHYDSAVAAVRQEGKPNIGSIMKVTGLKPPAARAIRDTMVQRGVLAQQGTSNTYRVIPPTKPVVMRARERGIEADASDRAYDQAQAEEMARAQPQPRAVEPIMAEPTATRDIAGPGQIIGSRIPQPGIQVQRTPGFRGGAAAVMAGGPQPAPLTRLPPFVARLRNQIRDIDNRLRSVPQDARERKGMERQKAKLQKKHDFAVEQAWRKRGTPHPALAAEQKMIARHNTVRAAILDYLKTRLKNLGVKPDKIKVALENLGKDVEGRAINNAIALGFDVHGGLGNPEIIARVAEVMNHELVHVFKNLGLIKPVEWNALVREAKRTLHPKVQGKTFQQVAEDTYSHLPTKEDIEEEAVAEMFRHWARDGKLSPASQSAFRKIIEFLRRLGEALRGMGFQSAQDVFKAIEAGEVGARAEGSAAPIRQDDTRNQQAGREARDEPTGAREQAMRYGDRVFDPIPDEQRDARANQMATERAWAGKTFEERQDLAFNEIRQNQITGIAATFRHVVPRYMKKNDPRAYKSGGVDDPMGYDPKSTDNSWYLTLKNGVQVRVSDHKHKTGFRKGPDIVLGGPRDENQLRLQVTKALGEWLKANRKDLLPQGRQSRAIDPRRDWDNEQADPNYAYHATNDDGFNSIQDDGRMEVFEPSHGTPDQDMWPDGGEEKRAYFAGDPQATAFFAPAEGRPVLLRVERAAFDPRKEKGTGDLYSRKPIDAGDIEYLSNQGWSPVGRESRSVQLQQAEGEPEGYFEIMDREGERIGHVQAKPSEDGKVVRINSILANRDLGTSEIRQLGRQMKQDFYPDMENVTGWRVSGSRAEPELVNVSARFSRGFYPLREWDGMKPNPNFNYRAVDDETLARIKKNGSARGGQFGDLSEATPDPDDDGWILLRADRLKTTRDERIPAEEVEYLTEDGWKKAGIAPGPVTLGERHEDEIGEDQYAIIDGNGRQIGHVATAPSPDGKTMRIEMISTDIEIGFAGMRSLGKQLKKLNPEMNDIGGFRITGARPEPAEMRVPAHFSRVLKEDVREMDREIASGTQEIERYARLIPQVQMSPRDEANHRRVFAQPAVNVNQKRGMAKVFGDFWSRRRQNWIDTGEAILRLLRHEALAKTGGEMPTADLSAYAKYQMAKRADSYFQDMIDFGGVPTVTRIDPNNPDSIFVENKGNHRALKEMLRPIVAGGLERQTQSYMAAKRGSYLDAAGRQHPLTQQEITDGLALGQKHPEIVVFDREYQAFNKDLMNFNVKAGVLDQKTADDWTKHGDYYPFYRQLSDKHGMPKMRGATSRGIGSQLKIHPLKGAPGIALHEDMVDAIMQNVQFWTKAGLDNIAAKAAADLGRRNGTVYTLMPRIASANSGSFFYRENGKTVQVYTDDQQFLDSVRGLELDVIPGWMRWLGMPARLLREMVTKDPVFMLGSNLLRDTVSAFVTGRARTVPVWGTLKGMYSALMRTTSSQALRAMGGAGGYDYKSASRFKSPADLLRREIYDTSGVYQVGTPSQALSVIRRVWRGMDRVSDASDMSTRNAVFESTLKRTGNRAQAAYEAIMSMPFHRRGASQFARAMTTMIPFLNARLQGLDVLWHGGLRDTAHFAKNMGIGLSPNAYKNVARFAFRGSLLTGFALAAMAYAEDDEDYAQVDDYIRDSNVLIPLRILGLGQRGFLSLPKPFEVGALFQTLPEHIVRLWRGTEDGTQMAKMLLSQSAAILGVPSIGGVPIPQAAMPLIEAGTNRSSFTGRPIVPRSEEALPANLQYDHNTSAIARLLGDVPVVFDTTTGRWSGVSPRTFDHLLKGYGGTIGGYILGASTYLINSFERDAPTRPAQSLSEVAGVRRFLRTPDNSSLRTVSEFYDLLHSAQEAQRGVNRMIALGQTEEALRSYRENANLIGMARPLAQQSQLMNQLRQRENIIRNDRAMTPEQKAESIRSIREMRVRITQNVDETRRRAVS